ncbi:MAG: dephospho-CoA kinase [Phycisphaerales bacterium]|nr:MAG: dephospho-CoA kinase [Phycisphaerales bacterium]
MRKPVIGLAGGIGSGKTAVGRILQEFGAGLIESDRLGHDELDAPEVVQTLKKWWGDQIVALDGGVDRGRVAAIAFADSKERKRLEALLHPRIAARRADLVRRFEADDSVRIIVIDAPLLYEAGVDAECDLVVFVEADPAVRAGRVRAQRNWTEQEWKRREKMQKPLDMKRRKADHILTNNSSLGALRGQVAHLVTRILRLDPKR